MYPIEFYNAATVISPVIRQETIEILTGTLKYLISEAAEDNLQQYTTLYDSFLANPDTLITPYLSQKKHDIKKVLKKFSSCPPAKELMQNVMAKIPGITVGSFPRVFCKGDALFDPNKKQICIATETTQDTAIASVLMESLNVLHQEKYFQVEDEAKAGNLSRNAYAQKFEAVECERIIEHHEIAKDCIEKNKWNPATDEYADRFENGMTAEQCWQDANDKSTHPAQKFIKTTSLFLGTVSHAENYRQDWDKGFKKFWCQKHPGDKDCQ